MASFRWGILGTGSVSRNFLLGLSACNPPAHVAVVASRERANAERFAAELGVPQVVDGAEALVASPDCDAIYVATPPSEHEAHALAAIRAGKPVLVEKPFALDAAAAGRIVAAAREARVFCMEGMWTRFLPIVSEVAQRVAAGEIGELRSFRADFQVANRPDPALSLFDPKRGGGALRHRGVYGLSLARHFLGPVDAVDSMATIGATGVDEDCVVSLRHRSGALSTIRASLRTQGSNDATLHGSSGVLRLEAPIYRPSGARLVGFEVGAGPAAPGPAWLERLRASGAAQGLKQRLARWLPGSGPGARIVRHFGGNGFHHEAEALMRAVREGALESALMPLDESLEVMTIIDQARAAWQRGASA